MKNRSWSERGGEIVNAIKCVRHLLLSIALMLPCVIYAQTNTGMPTHIKSLMEIEKEVIERTRDFDEIADGIRGSEKVWAREMSRLYWLTHAYIKGCYGVSLLYDLMHDSGKKRVLSWIREEKKYCTITLNNCLNQLLINQGYTRDPNVILYSDHLRSAIRRAQEAITKMPE